MGSFFPAQTGGTDNTVYWTTKAMKRRGHDPVVCSTDDGLPADVPRGRWLDRDYARVVYDRDRVHYLPLRTVRRALSELADADILHVTMITYPASWLTALANGWRHRRPIMWSVQGDLDAPMLKRSRRKKAAVLRLVKWIMRRQTVTFHTTCDEEDEYVRQAIGPEAVTVQVPNYMELPERIHVDKEKVFLFIGRIDAKKGIENLLHAVAACGAFRQNGFRLHVAGGMAGAYGDSIARLATKLGLDDIVTFLGHVAGVDKERILASAYCLVMPSHTENFGIVVNEALAQATPAIASTGTPWSVLEREGAGWWTDNDPTSLRVAMEAAMALSDEEYAQLSERALDLAHNAFDIHARVGEWEQAYKDLLARA